MVIELSTADYFLLMRMQISLSTDETLLPRYGNLSTNFRGLPFKELIVPSWFEKINYALNEFMYRPKLLLLSYAEEILLEQVHLQEALGRGHSHNIHKEIKCKTFTFYSSARASLSHYPIESVRWVFVRRSRST